VRKTKMEFPKEPWMPISISGFVVWWLGFDGRVFTVCSL